MACGKALSFKEDLYIIQILEIVVSLYIYQQSCQITRKKDEKLDS